MTNNTPPTKGHDNCLFTSLYDTTCASGYEKTYTGAQAFNLFGLDPNVASYTINYPDTTNTQNVMDYSGCKRMFTHLQSVRMRASLRSPIANRSNLISAANLAATGALQPRQDLPPIADFSVNKLSSAAGFGPNVFVCPGKQVIFSNRSWNDTVSSVQWSFSNGGSSAQTNPGFTASTSFTDPGWASATLTANSNAGSNTFTNPRAVYVANPNAISPGGYVQEFVDAEPEGFPMFNYFNNDSRWEVVNNAGFYDNMSIRYKNFDNRANFQAMVNTPIGDYDDFFTPAFDLSGTNDMKLNFFTSGAFRTNMSAWMLDTLEIRYSTNCGQNWQLLANVTRQEIGNNGVQVNEYTPGGFWDWKGQSINIPNGIAGNNQIFFRFRYKTFAGSPNQYGTSNHFYLDRIYLSNFTTDVASLESKNSGIALAPNPTTGSSVIMIKDVNSSSAQIQVTDVTGKVVYSTQSKLVTGVNRIEIPANAIAVKGMYLVKVVTGSTKHTEKLIVY